MPLPAPELDDRHFQDLVDEAKRLIPQFSPEWTNHNLSDPGVALIELFAWMSDLVLYRLNQVPDRYYTKFLDLVGIEPFPPSVARADLTFWLSSVLPDPVLVPAGTQVATPTAGDGERVVFSTTTDLVIAPPNLVAALRALAGDEEHFEDAIDDLRYEGGTVVCFASQPLTPGDAFYLGFEETLGGNVIELTIQASVEGIGVDPTDPPLVWEAWTGEVWIPLHVYRDTTGGINRDGTVALVMPMRHDALTVGGVRAHWLRARLLAPRAGQPAYVASPQIRSLKADSLGGTVAAEHAEQVGPESLGRSTGRPGQHFVVLHPPVLPRREGEGVAVTTNRGAETWREVDDFTRSGPTDRHFTWDGASGTIRFGPQVRYADGTIRQHGAIPPDGAEVSVTGYRHGGGAAGNVGAGTLRVLHTTVPYISQAENLQPALGGVDAESVDNAKLRGPMTIRTGQRAVTATDFERLTLESSIEVARARCLAPKASGGPVRLLVVPRVKRPVAQLSIDDFAISDALLQRVSGHLDERRILGTTVEVGTPYYQGVTVAALLSAHAGRPVNLIRQRALDLLFGYVNPVTGGPEAAGWPFDDDLNAAQISQLLETVEGVERVDEVLLFEYDLRTGVRQGPARDMIRLEPDSLFLSARHQVVVR
jgi:predicted phage baseplate assembly protein